MSVRSDSQPDAKPASARAGSGRLDFVSTALDAATPRSQGRSIVLDTAWTPAEKDRSSAVSLRPYFADVLECHDLFGEALVALDRWADDHAVADRLIVEDVTYWYRVRETMWHWLHERLLWRYALAAINVDASSAVVSAPASEVALVDVLRAMGRSTVIRDGPPLDPVADVGPRSAPNGGGRAVLRRALRSLRSSAGARRPADRHLHDHDMDERLATLSSLVGPRVIVLTRPSSHQRIGTTDSSQRRDPNLGSVIAELGLAGLQPIIIGLGMDPRVETDRASIQLDSRLLPGSLLRARWGRPEDKRRTSEAIAALTGSIDALTDRPLDLGGVDVGGPFLDALRSAIVRIVHNDVHQFARVERLIGELGPSALLLTQEGNRTPWLAVGRRAGVPTFALQHGILYPTHPGYADRRHPRLVLPSRMFVYGEYERRVLEGGAYHSGEVIVSGSPRLDLDAAAVGGAGAAAERTAIRRALAIADTDRMLVVSTLHLPFVRRSHLVHMLEVVLGGPLPGVHVVFKQHPGEQDEGPYRRLLAGLAEAGGYEPPPISLVKDIDLYRLLRAADAHLGLHSTVLSDAVVAGTCNLIARVEPRWDLLGYVDAGVALPIRDVVELREALRDARPPEPAARRAFIDEHFRPGDASARIVAAIKADIEGRASAGTAGAG